MTREGDEEIVATLVAVRAREALAKVAARQIRAQLLLDVAGQAALVVLARVGDERFEVLADELVEDRFCRAARQVRGREGSHDEQRASPDSCQVAGMEFRELA